MLCTEFGVVQASTLLRTSSNLSSTSNHIITEIAKCVEFCHMSSGWFDHTEPSLSGVQGAYALVRGGSSTSNLVEHSRTTHYRDSKVCRVLSHEFGVVRPYRTFSVYIVTGETRSRRCFALVRGGSSTSNHIITEIARCVEFCHMSSGWFDHTEPSLSLHRYRGNKECRVLMH